MTAVTIWAGIILFKRESISPDKKHEPRLFVKPRFVLCLVVLNQEFRDIPTVVSIAVDFSFCINTLNIIISI